MKKILFALLCLALCLPMALSAVAAIPTVSENDKVDIVVISRHDFDDVTEINRNASQSTVNANNGFVALDGLDCEIVDGALSINHSGRLDTSKTSTFFDFQFKHVEEFPLVSQDAIFSMKIKPVESFSSGRLLDWGVDGTLEGERVTISNLQLKIDGEVKGTLTQGEYSLVEWAFDYDDTAKKFTAVNVLLDGEIVGSYTPKKTISRIDFFRLLRYASGKSVIDDVTFALGNTSILYAKNAEESYDPNDFLPEIGESPIPVIPEADKVWMDIITTIDFNDVQTPNRELSTDKLNESKGFAAMEGLDCSIVDGELVVRSSAAAPNAYFDLQFFNVEAFTQKEVKTKLKGDVIFSFKVKPLTTNFNVAQLITYRFSTTDFDTNVSQIAGSNLKVNGQEVGALPYGVFSLVEYAFHYDKDNAEYDTMDVLLNGVKVASYDIEKSIARVNHFRMFNGINGQFAVDDITLACGNTSLVYYSPDAEPPVVNDPDNGGQNGNPTPNPDNGSTTEDVVTNEPTPDVTTEAPDTDDAKPAKKGCFSTVTAAGIGMLVSVMGAAFLKKREGTES